MDWSSIRRNSRGWQNDPPAKVHTNIVFGPGIYLNPGFVRHHSITHVINCAFDKDSPSWFRQKFPSNYACIEALDSEEEDILRWYPLFEDKLNSFLRDPSAKTIYIHCQCGINRSAFLALLFVCKKFHYSFENACQFILKQRPCAFTNSTYKKQVFDFIKNEFIKNDCIKNHITN